MGAWLSTHHMQPASLPSVRPHIGWDSSCSGNWVRVYSDAGQSGDTVNFCGDGAVNMNQVQRGWFGAYGNWDDIASSYQIYGSTCRGRFYSDPFERRKVTQYLSGDRYNFDGQSNRLYNDTLSSLDILGGCGVG